MKLEELKKASPSLIAKLNEIGVFSVEQLVVKGSELKNELPDVPEDELRNVCSEASQKCGFGLMTAAEHYELEKKRIYFSTGSKALDEVMGGGAWSWSIAEFYGEMGVGKSQIIQTMAVEAVFKGGKRAEKVEGEPENVTGSVVFIDSEATCRQSRIIEIAKARGYGDKLEILQKNLIYISAVDTETLFEIINRLPLTIENRNVKLICIDSLITPFRAEYIGREMLAARQQAIARALAKLKRMAYVYNIAVAITNQVVAVPMQTFTGFEYKPTGGFVLGHVSEPRVWIRRAEGSKRIARIVDSSWLPEREASFRLSEKGIEDM